MSGIFVGWALPDSEVADRAVSRLRDVGLQVAEYTDGMLPGDPIRDWIVNAIEEARVVVVFVSAAGLDHSDWVREEMTLAAGRLSRASNKLERLIVVRIGVFSSDRLPNMLSQQQIRFFDIEDALDESQLERLVGGVCESFKPSVPVVIPAAMYAMTAIEFAAMRGSADAAQKSRLVALCRSVGMPNEPVLWDELSRRHSATSEEFAPYADRQSLIQVTQDVVRGVNGTRKSNGRRPLYLRWFSHEELRQKAVRDQWARGPSILFVDSVSILDPDFMQRLQRLPHPREPRQAAVICLPPYTRHTGELEQLIEDCLEGQEFLSDRFREWRDENGLASLAFDIPTETSLRRWLDQVLLAFDTQLVPLPSRVRRMDPADPLSVPWLSAPGTPQ
jgi:hypothetical protein